MRETTDAHAFDFFSAQALACERTPHKPNSVQLPEASGEVYADMHVHGGPNCVENAGTSFPPARCGSL